jgi:hypothetical protein
MATEIAEGTEAAEKVFTTEEAEPAETKNIHDLR